MHKNKFYISCLIPLNHRNAGLNVEPRWPRLAIAIFKSPAPPLTGNQRPHSCHGQRHEGRVREATADKTAENANARKK